MVYLPNWSVILLKQIAWLYITLKAGSLSILGRFAQSYMAQNHPPSWEQKFSKLGQMILKTFQKSEPSIKLLNSGSHMLVFV